MAKKLSSAAIKANKLSPFAELALGLRTNNYSPLPIVAPIIYGNSKGAKWTEIDAARAENIGHGKRPVVSGWQGACRKQPKISWLKEHFPDDGTQLGVACGFNGLTGFDFDTESLPILKAARRFFRQIGGKVAVKKGKRGFTVFATCPNLTRSFKFNFGNGHLDILHMGRQSILPPSIHPGTEQPYTWLGENTLYNTPVSGLTIIELDEAALIAALDDVFAPWVADQKEARANEAPALRRKIHKDELKQYEAYAKAGLKNERNKLAKTQEGNRGRRVLDSACALGKFVWHGLLEDSDVEDAILDACDKNGLLKKDGADSITSQIERGFAYAKNDPLHNLNPGKKDEKTATPLRLPEPYKLIGLENTPKQKFIYGAHYARGFVSTTIAPGNAGKTRLLVAEALAMASGEALLGTAPEDRVGVWYYVLEGPFDDMQRRVEACAEYYASTSGPVDIGKRLFISSALDEGCKLQIAIRDQGGIKIVEPVVEAIEKHIQDNNIAVLIIDPFIKSHAIEENDNTLIDKVVQAWAQIAHNCNCAVELVHHARKTGNQPISLEDARGASALISAARGKRTLNRMSKSEYEQTQKTAGPVVQDDQRHYVRIDSETNLAPASKAKWMYIYDYRSKKGHSVGVATEWEFPETETLVVDDFDQVDAALKLIREGGPWRKDSRSQNEPWVGIPIASALGLDPEDKMHKEQIRKLIIIWLADDVLKCTKTKGKNGNMVPYIEAGTAPERDDDF